MIKVYQTKFHNPPKVVGNCFAACVASLMESRISAIPAFEDWMHEKDWATKASQYFAYNGWEWGSLDGHIENEFYLVIGKSARGVNHCCVYFNGKLFHDPHPSQDGLLSEDYFEFLNRIL